MNTPPQILKESRASMEKGMDSVRRELAGIRTGKATTGLLDTIRVDVYGQSMLLTQVASISAPEPRLLTVTPWDKSQMQNIERAIRDSDLGLNPASQGGVIRVPLPALTEERRKDLVKVVHRLVEEGRIAIRHVRTEAREKLKHLDKVSEDDVKHAEKDLQKLHDEFIGKMDDLMKSKEAEIMEV